MDEKSVEQTEYSQNVRECPATRFLKRTPVAVKASPTVKNTAKPRILPKAALAAFYALVGF